MSEGMLAAVAGVAAVLVTLAQWFFSSRAASRQRDVEMTQWGHEVIDVMAEIETACSPLSSETKYSPAKIEKLSERASALVDKGRLFFPNVKDEGRRTLLGLSISWPPITSKRKPIENSDDKGTRVAILDHVLRACYAARHLAIGFDGDKEALRAHVWQSRGDFVSLLQKEMGNSLRRKDGDGAGEHVPKDPRFWGRPERPLTLPLSGSLQPFTHRSMKKP
ncbi:hypothetical protein IB238_01670 [Rhizobium sp. ARZ01]|uniref:hypothetical protein n=1 Tax=Rhizobium sp. ARZ01 TaxID=2769313 RepID=UPI00177BBC66|nr:hypothetical protein [Rhizobium sp. ARZ01]MBD9371347.1 hypothetical protein [Rhizobium sp. ARZ01]